MLRGAGAVRFCAGRTLFLIFVTRREEETRKVVQDQLQKTEKSRFDDDVRIIAL